MKPSSRLTIYHIILRSILLLLFAGAVAMFIREDYFKAIVSLVSIAAILLPSFLYSNVLWFKERFSVEFLRTVEMTTAIGIVLNSLGTLGLYYVHLEYYGVLHFAVTAIIAFLLMSMIGVSMKRNGKQHYISWSRFWGAFITFIVVVVIWEAYEYFADIAFGTMLSIDPGQPGVDTYVDMIWDVVGITVASIFGYYNLEGFIKKFEAKKVS